jgi:hypothetical protein
MTVRKRIRQPATEARACFVINRVKAAETIGATEMMAECMVPDAPGTSAPIAKVQINGEQALILQVLRAADSAGGLTRLELEQAVQMCRTFARRQLIGLHEQLLVHELPLRLGSRATVLGITLAGWRAYWTYRHKLELAATKALAAPALTYNTRGQAYVPAANAYYRNNGNVHIASQGVKC